MQTNLWAIGFLIFCALSQAALTPAFCQVSTEERERQVAKLLHFDETGKLDDPEVKRAVGLQLDMFAAYLPRETDIKVGIGLVVWRGASTRLRATAQIADGAIGAGLAYTLVPVIDLSVGVGALYDVNQGRTEPSIYASLYRW